MLLDADDSILILVDYQARLMPAMADADATIKNATRLAQAARELSVPVWATEQNPAKLGDTLPELACLCDQRIAKMSFSAEAVLSPLLEQQSPKPAAAAAQSQGGNARSLPKHLRRAPPPAEPERGALVLAGCETHVCLMQTALELTAREWDVWVVTDACGSRTERNRDAAYDRMAAAGCELLTTEMVLFEWLRTAQHPRFKAIQALIK
ncbi:MAG: isochorismatase family protein [Burkholderiaceae bacterium]|jgi:nicotinamidase-related amidase|nr:isochorismatase family protein [Burkholderiaceae bacterium]